jgi:hypothetical protein
MNWVLLWRLLHLFFAFGFVGTLVVSDWNSRAARGTQDWRERALLWGIVRRAGGVGLGTLLALGIMGNILLVGLGYRMSGDTWPRWVNALWLVAVIVQGAIITPGASRLAGLAKAAAEGGTGEGYGAALKGWRLGTIVQSLLYVALLVLMVLHWRS